MPTTFFVAVVVVVVAVVVVDDAIAYKRIKETYNSYNNSIFNFALIKPPSAS